jgi:hypothetical protein
MSKLFFPVTGLVIVALSFFLDSYIYRLVTACAAGGHEDFFPD